MGHQQVVSEIPVLMVLCELLAYTNNSSLRHQTKHLVLLTGNIKGRARGCAEARSLLRPAAPFFGGQQLSFKLAPALPYITFQGSPTLQA